MKSQNKLQNGELKNRRRLSHKGDVQEGRNLSRCHYVAAKYIIETRRTQTVYDKPSFAELVNTIGSSSARTAKDQRLKPVNGRRDMISPSDTHPEHVVFVRLSVFLPWNLPRKIPDRFAIPVRTGARPTRLGRTTRSFRSLRTPRRPVLCVTGRVGTTGFVLASPRVFAWRRLVPRPFRPRGAPEVLVKRANFCRHIVSVSSRNPASSARLRVVGPAGERDEAEDGRSSLVFTFFTAGRA